MDNNTNVNNFSIINNDNIGFYIRALIFFAYI